MSPLQAEGSLNLTLRDSNRSQFNPGATHVCAHAWPHAHEKVWTWYIMCELIALAKSSCTDLTKSHNICQNKMRKKIRLRTITTQNKNVMKIL